MHANLSLNALKIPIRRVPRPRPRPRELSLNFFPTSRHVYSIALNDHKSPMQFTVSPDVNSPKEQATAFQMLFSQFHYVVPVARYSLLQKRVWTFSQKSSWACPTKLFSHIRASRLLAFTLVELSGGIGLLFLYIFRPGIQYYLQHS